MAGPSPKQRFHYLGVLEALHKRCGANRENLRGADVQNFAKLQGASFANALNKLRFRIISKVSGKPKILLKLGADNSRRLEQKLLNEIEEATVGRRRDRGIHPQPWPPLLTVQQVTERFVALALGLHAQDRISGTKVVGLAGAIAASARQTLAPAFAWAFLMETARLDEEDRRLALKSLRSQLAGRPGGEEDPRAGLPELARVLTLAKAWHEVLSADLGLGAKLAREAFGEAIVQLLESDHVADCQATVLARLLPTFGWGDAGSARALAIEQARKFGGLTARRDTRVNLLEAAHSSHVRPFRSDLERQVDVDQLKPIQGGKVGDALRFAGEAFWLSRECFRKTAGAGFTIGLHAKRPDGEVRSKVDDHRRLDRLSTLCLERLQLALGEYGLSELERVTLLRFRAGFSTNPRYWRSAEVVGAATEAVKAYKKHGDANPALAAHFEARLAWMESADKEGDPGGALDRVIDGYAEALSQAGTDFMGLDAEAPVHFFPELVHLMELRTRKGSNKTKDVLETVDFILSRNFGVYMDMEAERAAIVGGMSQAACHRVANKVAGMPTTKAGIGHG